MRYFVSVIKPDIHCRDGHEARLCGMIHEALTLGDEVYPVPEPLIRPNCGLSSESNDYTMKRTR